MQLISPQEQQDATQIFVIKYMGLGDSVLTFSAIEYLKELFPKAEIQYMVSPEFYEAFKNLESPRVKIVTFNIRKTSGFLSFVNFLLKNQFDFIFEFHQIGRTRKFFKLLRPFLKGRYYFHNHSMIDPEVIHFAHKHPIIQKDLDLLLSVVSSQKEKPYDENLFLKYAPKLSLKGLHAPKDQVVISMVASHRYKTWPTKSYNELIWEFSKRYPQTQIICPISDWPVDAVLKKEINTYSWPETFHLVQPELSELAKILYTSKFFLGHDTGQKHLAVALGVPTMTFIGPTVAKEWHPYSRTEHPIFFIDNLPCRTETQEHCEKFDCPDRICLNKFTPQQVLVEVEKVLQRSRG